MIEYADPNDGRDHHGWRVNSQGRRWISNPAGKGRDLLYDGASSWPFDDYAGIDPIYSQRGQWVHTLTELIDGDEHDYGDHSQRGVELGIPLDVQDEIAAGYIAFRKAHGLTAVHIEVKCVNDEHRVAGTIDRIDRTADGRHVIADIKGLDVNTTIPTPSGWATIGSLEVGDRVIGSDGKPCNVIGKSEIRNRPCYRIVFDDGAAVVADDEHRWIIDDSRLGGSRHIRTTHELAVDFNDATARGDQKRQRINNAAPLDLPAAELPVHPYVLGLWLADGNRSNGVISKPVDSLIWHEMIDCGYGLGVEQIDKRTGCCSRTALGLSSTLGLMGLLGNKHVPDAYLRASESQRLELLRGLMDGDGTVNTARKNRVVFTNTNKAISAAVYELVVSLGERAHQSSNIRTGFGLTVTAHDVEWAPLIHNPFAAEKASRTECSRTGRNHRRLIVAIDEVPSVPTQCIAVDSPDNSYLCTESMIPTHNTGGDVVKVATAVQLALYAGAVPYDIDTDTRGEWVA